MIFLIVLYLGLSIFEYHLYLSAKVKTILILVGVILQLIVFVSFIFLPLRGLLNKKSRISYRKAISLISAHYPDLEDKLLNTYELNEKASHDSEENTLLIASINKRIASLKLLSFRKSISFKDAYIYLKYLMGVLLFAISIYFVFQIFYPSSRVRLIHFQKDFKAPSDFEFLVKSKLFAEKERTIF